MYQFCSARTRKLQVFSDRLLAVSGDIPSQLVLKAEDLAKMPRETVSIPEQDGTKVEYEGVPLREILKRAGAPVEKELRGKALASYVLAKAHDGYQVVFTLAEVAPEFANEPITGGRQARRKTAVRIPGSVPAGVPERQGRRPLGTPCSKLSNSSGSRNDG
jgi:hypothetical protein